MLVHHGGYALTEHRCTLVEIKQEIAGFDGFIGSWVYRDDINFVVDVGPASSISYLTRALSEMGITKVDYVLLTHIHIDHAGGLGARRVPRKRDQAPRESLEAVGGKPNGPEGDS